jgi:hypothetical protein
LDSTDDPTHGQQQLSFFNGAYGQHMYHPMLIFERHIGSLLPARLQAGMLPAMPTSCPCCCAWCRGCTPLSLRLKIKRRGDAGFALPLLYQFCEFCAIEYALGISANRVFQQRAEPQQKQPGREVGTLRQGQRSQAELQRESSGRESQWSDREHRIFEATERPNGMRCW